MPQTKRQKRERVLVKLQEEYNLVKDRRENEQKRNNYFLFHTTREDYLVSQIRDLKRKLGLNED